MTDFKCRKTSINVERRVETITLSPAGLGLPLMAFQAETELQIGNRFMSIVSPYLPRFSPQR
jgi:hypothetical protein